VNRGEPTGGLVVIEQIGYEDATWRLTIGSALAALLASGAGVMLAPPAASAQMSAGAFAAAPVQLAYTALTPARIADTRCGVTPAPSFCTTEALPSSNAALATLPAGGTVTVAMPSTVPPTAAAVVLNVAAVDQNGSGFLTVWPAGQAMPPTANENFAPSQAAFGVSNLVTVDLGSSGSTPAVSVYDGPATGGSVDVTVDLQGYYAAPVGNAGGFTAESPVRIADSRCSGSSAPSFCASEALPSANAGVITLGPGATDTLTVAGVGGVPSTGAAAAIMNVAVTDASAPSFLSAYPGATRPQVANLNWTAGETLSNKVLVDLGPSGQVALYNNSGTVDVVIDVDGWFSGAASTTAASLFTPLSPTRLADTRCGASPTPAACASEGLVAANAKLSSPGGGQSVPVTIAGQDGVPASATAAVLNVTDVDPQSGNYLTVYPAGSPTPLASDVNFVPADPYDVVPNASYADLGSGGAGAVANGPVSAGATDVVVDLFGYFSPAASQMPSAGTLASPTSLAANGTSTSTLTTTLQSLGVALPGVSVVLSELPSTSGACGTLSPASGATDAAGQLVSTYTSSTVPGTCTITASLDGLAPSTVLTQTAPGTGSSNNSVAMSASPATIMVGLLDLAGGSSTVTATVDSPSGSPVSGDMVSFSASCGSVSPSSVTTGSTGQASVTYSAPAGLTAITQCTVGATEAATGQSGSTTITILL